MIFEEQYWAFEENVRSYLFENLKSYYEELLKDVEEEVKPPRNNLSMLDIGCGYGYLSRIGIERGYECIGVDISRYALSKVENKSSGVVLCNAQLALPLKSASIEIVMMIDVIEHLNRPYLALREVARVLKPEGLLYIATPNSSALAKLLQGQKWYGYLDKTHVSLFTTHSLKATLKTCNFEIVKCHTPFTLPFSSKPLKRIFQRSGLGGQIRLIARKVP